jgi:hypothetical protein
MINWQTSSGTSPGSTQHEQLLQKQCLEAGINATANPFIVAYMERSWLRISRNGGEFGGANVSARIVQCEHHSISLHLSQPWLPCAMRFAVHVTKVKLTATHFNGIPRLILQCMSPGSS